ncbi:hypothetical protein [Sphingobacterium sp. 1.A.5]|uniref:hypothetical protein n=1 Tax=Sphingobacterium sp. 1.A.5 TaxID=2044604 RepID=UPI000C0BC453|nr:hypothetical protein [Sphingobacterium sp. 1.A.5]
MAKERGAKTIPELDEALDFENIVVDDGTPIGKRMTKASLKALLTIEGTEIEPLVGGDSSATALVVANGPSGEQRTAEVASGKWYDFGSGPVLADADRRWKAYWNGSSWSLKDMGALPQTVISNTKGTSTTAGASQKLVSDNIDEVDKIKNQIGVNDRIINGDFTNGITNWSKNEIPVTISVVDGVLSVNTTGGTDPAVTQSIPSMASGIYNIEIRVRRTSSASIILRAGVTSNTTFNFTLSNTDWNVYKGTINVTATGNKTFLISIPKDAQVEVDYVKCYSTVDNSLFSNVNNLDARVKVVEPVVETVGVENKLRNNNFNNGLVDWTKNENLFTMDIQDGNLHITTSSNPNVGVLQSSVPATVGTWVCEIRMKKVAGSSFQFTLGTYTPGQKRTAPITVASNNWETYSAEIELLSTNISGTGFVGYMIGLTSNIEVLIEYVKFYKKVNGSIDDRLNTLEKSNIDTSWLPKPIKSISPLKTWLQPFIDKYLSRTQDVTLVQIGDSISTDLNWTNKRPDANERPPFCTEYNFNSYLEEKLRWKQQKYRRYDYAGVFTEILGGGTASVLQSDATNWGFTGNSYYLPLTKVIDGGTNSGISFSMPANIKRLGLIVHTDKAWATSTVVSISGGNGKVEVFDGTNWVEANGYSTTFKEVDTVASLGFNTDNAQKRLNFRSLTDLTEKTITVQNVGVGRFGYWGIEYSPFEYMFTYICASKGSHDVAMLQRYESWMVDSFNPNLIVWQCPILNTQFGVVSGARNYPSTNYGSRFVTKYNALLAKGYLVLPLNVWAATYSNFVDTNGNFLYAYTTTNGFVSCQADADNMLYKFDEINVPFINLFPRITEVAKNKAEIDQANIYTSALISSGKDGYTFTYDGIHLNKLGNQVYWNLMENYFNF